LAARLEENSTQSTDSKGDLLPLPLPIVATDEQQVRQFLAGDASSDDLQNIDEEVGARCWETCVTLVINHLYFSPQSDAGRGGEKLPWPSAHHRASSNQKEARRLIADEVEDFLRDRDGQEIPMLPKDWKK